ncbi:hypothetical protein BDV25DRAFT_94670 [Aspergillus avenaceus]|uniref:Pre-rRNA-processing protein ESF2 n=1 Tax=Aspergillus avenaceus TaxID=36643 RepID=A0A5N6U816_ASPAV|nr:hypothetical protein BDV25DRAFT_94670 [Aspergillus avenaceus]
MTTKKPTDYLNIVGSDEEDSDRGYDSEAAEESKGRITKRRRTQPHAADEVQSDSEGLDDSGNESEEEPQTRKRTSDSEDPSDLYLETPTEEAPPQKSKGALKPPKKNKTGVIYLSSLPPYLKPFALKSMLETRGFGPITKVFLSPAVKSANAPRRRSNKRKTYTDGWVEFASKKTAKICAETLNASIVGGRKGSWYHDDVWNIIYLRGMKWADLMEQMQRERREREAKQRIEDTRARKEDKVFLQGVETGKVLDGMQRKNEEKRKRKVQSDAPETGGEGGEIKVRRTFKQNEVKRGRHTLKDGEVDLGDDTKRVLGKIF